MSRARFHPVLDRVGNTPLIPLGSLGVDLAPGVRNLGQGRMV